MLKENYWLFRILFTQFSWNPEYVENIPILCDYLVLLGQVSILVGKLFEAFEGIWRIKLEFTRVSLSIQFFHHVSDWKNPIFWEIIKTKLH
jgi:hypothetical protein